MDFRDYQKFAYNECNITGVKLEEFTEHNMNGFNMPSMMTPNIVEERKMNVAILDVFSMLIKSRIIYLGTPVTDYVANVISAQLLYLNSVDPKADISLYINSPGGSVYAGLGIYDTMQFISNDVSTLCTSIACSMGSVLLTAGSFGKRSALKNSRIMAHEISGGFSGKFKDQRIQFEEATRVRDILYNIYVDHTGKTFKEIEEICDNGDRWMSGQEAKELNMIDDVLMGSKPIRTSK